MTTPEKRKYVYVGHWEVMLPQEIHIGQDELAAVFEDQGFGVFTDIQGVRISSPDDTSLSRIFPTDMLHGQVVFTVDWNVSTEPCYIIFSPCFTDGHKTRVPIPKEFYNILKQFMIRQYKIAFSKRLTYTAADLK